LSAIPLQLLFTVDIVRDLRQSAGTHKELFQSDNTLLVWRIVDALPQAEPQNPARNRRTLAGIDDNRRAYMLTGGGS